MPRSATLLRPFTVMVSDATLDLYAQELDKNLRRSSKKHHDDLILDAVESLSKKRKPSKNKQGENDFAFACRVFKLPEPQQQFKLLKTVQTPRKDNKKIPNEWKFDFVWPDFKLIVEIDGGVWMAGGGAHSHPVDIVRNMAKRNDAALAGFVIVAFTPQQVTKGEAIAFTQKMLAARGWKR